MQIHANNSQNALSVSIKTSCGMNLKTENVALSGFTPLVAVQLSLENRNVKCELLISRLLPCKQNF